MKILQYAKNQISIPGKKSTKLLRGFLDSLTLHIKVKDKETYNHLMWFLKKFDKRELQVFKGKNSFSEIQRELQKELDQIDSGNSGLIDLEDLDMELERIISSDED